MELSRQSSRYLAVEVRFGRWVFLGAVYVPGLGKLLLVFHRTFVRFPALHLVRLVQLKYCFSEGVGRTRENGASNKITKIRTCT